MRVNFTVQEDKVISTHYKSASYEELARLVFNVRGTYRTTNSVKGRIYRLGLRKGIKPRLTYSDEELAYIDTIVDDHPLREIVALVNTKFNKTRSYYSVQRKLYNIRKIRKNDEKQRVKMQKPIVMLKEKPVMSCSELIRAMSYAEINAYRLARAIGTTKNHVIRMMTEVGVPETLSKRVKEVLEC